MGRNVTMQKFCEISQLSSLRGSSYWKKVFWNCLWNLISFDIVIEMDEWLKILDHVYCDKWCQARNFWPFILKSWIISMKMSTVFFLTHVMTPLPSTQSKLKSFPNSNSESSLSNVKFNWFVTLFQRSWGREAWVSWPRCTCRMAGDLALVWSSPILETERVSVRLWSFFVGSELVR